MAESTFMCLYILGGLSAYQELYFQNRELQIMRKLEHLNIVKLKFFFYSAGEKVCTVTHL